MGLILLTEYQPYIFLTQLSHPFKKLSIFYRTNLSAYILQKKDYRTM